MNAEKESLVERIECQLAAMPAFEKNGGAGKLLVEARDAINEAGLLLSDVLKFRRAVRAVIAARRPHTWKAGNRAGTVPCTCARCTAWDELAELLKEP